MIQKRSRICEKCGIFSFFMLISTELKGFDRNILCNAMAWNGVLLRLILVL